MTPRKGEKLRDMRTGRVGTFTGEVQTSAPPRYCVTWDDDSSAGAIGARHAMHCVDASAVGQWHATNRGHHPRTRR